MYSFFIFFFIVMSRIVTGYDLVEGFLQLEDSCFGTIHSEDCNSSLPQAYPVQDNRGVNIPDTKLFLFTRKNPDKAELLHKCGGKLPKKSDFNPKAETVLISHGWLDGVCRTAWMREMKELLFLRGEYNVILIDWTWGNTVDPAEAAGHNSFVVGDQVGFTIRNIMKQTHMKNGDLFHLIGHSYGTYVINQAAKRIWEKAPEKKVRRMTFLDPGIAPITNANSQIYFNRKYAKFIDVIHGDAGDCILLDFGIYTPVGHVDFYPNGGDFQVSCYSYALASLLKLDLFYGALSLYPAICSHLQTIQYFKASILHPGGLFVGVECSNYTDFIFDTCEKCCKDDFSNCAVMGMDAEYHFPKENLNEKGYKKYYLVLGAVCPYNENYKLSVLHDCPDKKLSFQKIKNL